MTPPTESYREIPLTKGQVAWVSEHRYAELTTHRWRARWCTRSKHFYAVRNIWMPGGKYRTIYMHRYILGLEHGDKRTGDHRDQTATLNNTDSNLRIATKAEQSRNRGKNRSSKSGVKGVHYCTRLKGWVAQICVNWKKIRLGVFLTKEEASACYQAAVAKYHGEFANVGDN